MQLALTIDDYGVAEFCELLRAHDERDFHYVVTPNVDHVIRYCDDAEFRLLYAQASHILLDSRFLANLLALTGKLRARACPGSDLTSRIFSQLIGCDDRVLLVGAAPWQAQALSEQFGLTDLHHIDPPMGFIHNPAYVDACLRAVEAVSPFRFCFLAIGSPQQEILAYRLKLRGLARGTALCVGASINFITGAEHRAPHWMQRIGLEWLFRFLHDPKRLATRYLLRGPRIFWLLPRLKLRLRAPIAVDQCGSDSSAGSIGPDHCIP